MDPLDAYMESLQAEATEQVPLTKEEEYLSHIYTNHYYPSEKKKKKKVVVVSSNVNPQAGILSPSSPPTVHGTNTVNVTSRLNTPSLSSAYSSVNEKILRQRRFIVAQRMIETGNVYFSDSAMKERDTVMYHEYLGRYLDPYTPRNRYNGNDNNNEDPSVMPVWRHGLTTYHDLDQAIQYAATGNGIPEENEKTEENGNYYNHPAYIGSRMSTVKEQSIRTANVSAVPGLRHDGSSSPLRTSHPTTDAHLLLSSPESTSFLPVPTDKTKDSNPPVFSQLLLDTLVKTSNRIKRENNTNTNASSLSSCTVDVDEEQEEEDNEESVGIITTTTTTTGTGNETVGYGRTTYSASTITQRRSELLYYMLERFLRGDDKDYIDYSLIDNTNDDSLCLLNRDNENDTVEKYFEEEEEEEDIVRSAATIITDEACG